MFLQALFGEIGNPLKTLNDQGYEGLQQGGLIAFANNLIKLIIVVAGIYAFINLLTAGFDHIASEGDPKRAEAAKAKILNSLIGIVIMVASFALTAVISKIFFGSYDAILNPKIYGPGVPTSN